MNQATAKIKVIAVLIVVTRSSLNKLKKTQLSHVKNLQEVILKERVIIRIYTTQ